MSEFTLHGATLAFAWYFGVNAAASLAIASIARRGAFRRTASPSIAFGARMLPAAAAGAFVAALFVPSYWRFEPRDGVEGFDVTLSMLAIGGAAIVAAGLVRGADAWRRARRRMDVWMRSARPIALASAGIPAFEIDVDAPMLALAGVVRPRLLVTRGLRAALTPEELDASVAHELGHRRAFDNLKRLAMRAAPDLLALLPSAGAIERRWASAAEHSADLHAGHGAARRCALASALVKVARLAPPATPAAEPISTLVGGGDIASRVQRLLGEPSSRPRVRRHKLAAVAVAAAASVAFAYVPLLAGVHELTELLVRVLP